jgi:hypothetical protein
MITENTSTSAVLIKYDQSGSFVFARKLKHTTVGTEGTAIHVNVTDDIFVTGYSFTTSYEPFVAKYNSTGQLQWKRTFDGSLSYTQGISTDSTGKIYIAASIQIGSVIGGYIAILDSVDANNISNTTAVGLTLNDGSELAASTLTIADSDATTLLDADATTLLDAADTALTDTAIVPVVVHERAH